VWWIEAPGGLKAQRVPADSPGERGGVKPGDLLLSANNVPTPVGAALAREIWRTGAYNTIHYTLERHGIRLPDVPVILDVQDRSIHQGFRFIALVYLGIGLYVLLRRWTAPHSTHFYIFCLVSFVLYSFWTTGKFNEFDWIVYWSKIKRKRSAAGSVSALRAGVFRRTPRAPALARAAHLFARRLDHRPPGDGHRGLVGNRGAAPSS
jgi:two-component system, NtrC family, sensor kinase